MKKNPLKIPVFKEPASLKRTPLSASQRAAMLAAVRDIQGRSFVFSREMAEYKRGQEANQAYYIASAWQIVLESLMIIP